MKQFDDNYLLEIFCARSDKMRCRREKRGNAQIQKVFCWKRFEEAAAGVMTT